MHKKAFLQYCTDNGIPAGEELYVAITKDANSFFNTARQVWPGAIDLLIEEHRKTAGA